jgi:hypothetical protein
VIDVEEAIAVRQASDEPLLGVQHRRAVHVHPKHVVAHARSVTTGGKERRGRDPEGRLDRRESDDD